MCLFFFNTNLLRHKDFSQLFCNNIICAWKRFTVKQPILGQPYSSKLNTNCSKTLVVLYAAEQLPLWQQPRVLSVGNVIKVDCSFKTTVISYSGSLACNLHGCPNGLLLGTGKVSNTNPSPPCELWIRCNAVIRQTDRQTDPHTCPFGSRGDQPVHREKAPLTSLD